MDFGLTDEQSQLAEAERSWLERHDPLARLRTMLDVAPIIVDPRAVSHAAESGLLALLTDDMGGSHIDLAVLSETHGAAASSLPIADLALAVSLLTETGLPQANQAAEGQLLTSITWGASGVETDGGSVHLSGRFRPLPMAVDMAAIVVVGELHRNGTVDEYAAVLENPPLTSQQTMDLTRSWASVKIDVDVPAGQWVVVPPGTLARIRDALAVHRAFDALGAAARLLEMTVTYSGQRQQFGVPIGSFQAVKHHCANMVMGVEAGRSTLWASALALDMEGPDARRRAASSGAAFAKSAASEVAQIALQVHGGIGFTWEHDLHLLLRRIKVDEAMNGSISEHRATLVTA